MSGRREKLARLHAELDTLALFDRVHDNTTDPNPADNRAHSLRQTRRSEIIAEIEKLEAIKPKFPNTGRGTAVLILGAIGYATLYYFLK
jgi:hypothetical protein